MNSRFNLTQEEINQIINDSIVCHVSMVDQDSSPYVLPFNFGYKDNRLYLHCAPEGKKIKIWESNPRVCVAFSTDYKMRVQNENVACSYTMRYKSVLIYGKVIAISGYNEKIDVMNIFMEKYSGRKDFTYNSPAINNVKVFEILIDKIEGKIYGY